MAETKRLSDRNKLIQELLTDGKGLMNFYRFVAQNPHINLHDACQIVINRPNASVCFLFSEWNLGNRFSAALFARAPVVALQLFLTVRANAFLRVRKQFRSAAIANVSPHTVCLSPFFSRFFYCIFYRISSDFYCSSQCFFYVNFVFTHTCLVPSLYLSGLQLCVSEVLMN